MGSDDLFHKRKAKSTGDLARRAARRERYEKVLIVCEGEKTEPYYFLDLKDHYALSSANIEITGDCGSDPVSIIKHAKRRYREEKAAGDAFDKVYCVLDKDAHVNYNQAMDEIRSATPKKTFIAITSIPCFEYWLLLHFEYTTRPYAGGPGNSACNQLLTELKGHMPGYAKGQQGVFTALFGQLDYARHNAIRALDSVEANHTDNPSTRVHELVEYQQNIKHAATTA